jgi:transcriptional regulator of acetoin/glycerol metabolism
MNSDEKLKLDLIRSLEKHNFSVSSVSRETGLSRGTIWKYAVKYGLKIKKGNSFEWNIQKKESLNG